MADQPGLFDLLPPASGYREIGLQVAEPLRLWVGWCSEPGLLERLTSAIQWEHREIHMHGQTIPMPRLERWFAPEAGVPYVYSGLTYYSHALDSVPALEELRLRVQETTGEAFDSVFANLYRSGRDSIGWHADDPWILGPADGIVIASVSLGTRRPFQVRRIAARGSVAADERVSIPLGEGDLLLMGRRVQSHYVHQAPKTEREVGPRLVLTFRRLLGWRR